MDDATQYYLGIDIGTTSVKLCVIDNNGEIVSRNSKDTKAETGTEHCQDAYEILNAIEECMESLWKANAPFEKVRGIGICGQMHGVCMWKFEENSNSAITFRNWKISKLYTWMDERCDAKFLESLPRPKSHLKLSSGHGCATLFWLSKFCPEEISEYDSAGTIMDLLVAILCHLREPVMSTQNAASWGYFDTLENTFNTSILQANGFPVHLLPNVQPYDNSIAGKLHHTWCQIQPGTLVGVALGDLQCSVYSMMSTFKSIEPAAFVNISTSAQIGYITHKMQPRDDTFGVEYFPYFGSNYLTVGASLNGGNVLASFVNTIENILKDFGVDVTKEEIWAKVISAGNSVDVVSTNLIVSPLMFGERHCPEAKCVVSNITSSNHNLGHFILALCKGLVDNLAKFISPEELLERNITTLLATGSALTRNIILKNEIITRFHKINVIFQDDNIGAPFGAAEYIRLQNTLKDKHNIYTSNVN